MYRLLIAMLAVAAALAAVSAAAAVPSTPIVFTEVFEDLDPCSGDLHTVTIVIETMEHVTAGAVAAHAHRTITTSSGYTGHGSFSFVDNGSVIRVTNTDVVKSATGSMFRAHAVVVFDLRAGDVRVERVGLTCIRA